MFTSGFCNPFNEYDVNDDGIASPIDVLLVIDSLNQQGPGALEDASSVPGSFVDVNGDQYLAPFDVLLLINHLNTGNTSDLPIVASLAPESDPDGNRVVLVPEVVVHGQTAPGAKVRLTVADGVVQLTTADAQGVFRIPLLVDPGTTTFRVAAIDSQKRSTYIDQSLNRGDVVLDWNAAMLTVIRDWTTLSNDPYPNRIVTSQPPMVARNLAMVHTAMFDAVNAIEQSHESYATEIAAAEGASTVAAAAAAAHRVASSLYREQDEIAVFDAALAEALNSIPDGPERAAGLAIGYQVGDAIVNLRKSDGASTRVTYVPGTDPGDWQRTFPDFFPPLLPQWPNVTPFAMSTPDQFRPSPPPELGSAEYAEAVDEVMRLGGLGSSERSAEQTEIALFWADGGGTSTPAGHWNQIAADVAVERATSLQQNARLFALLNIAMADAGIASWDAKYAYNLWRPIDAIRKADTDSNNATTADPAWSPLLRTPPFPTYTSGHSTFSGAAEVILTSVFGPNVHFSSLTDGQTGFTQRPLSPERIVRRSFDSFAEAAEEASLSRVYGGIHFEFDSAAGIAAGRSIGNHVLANVLRERTDSL